MKIVILSTFEKKGGAAVAAHRLMEALNKNGHEAKMLVRDKQTNDEHVVSVNTSFIRKKINFLRFAWERFVIFAYNGFSKKNLFAVSIANTGTNISNHPLIQEADIIHLHWINQGFLSLKNIQQLTKLGKPIIWTMHDMWAFNGICHYKTPERNHVCMRKLDEKIQRKKRHLYQNKKFSIVGCSQWMARLAQQSGMFPKAHICAIPNPIDTSLYRPQSKQEARAQFKLPPNKKLILFASAKLSDERKGLQYFIEASNMLNDLSNEVEIVFFGGEPDTHITSMFSLKTYMLGYLNNPNKIISAYAACDIFVVPSLEDNLPNTIMEAMACGLPCVGFDTGGIPEMIDHKVNGYIAHYKSGKDLAQGIRWVLYEAEYNYLSQNAIQKTLDNYNEFNIVEKYMSLIKD